jgi:hypothetical protein
VLERMSLSKLTITNCDADPSASPASVPVPLVSVEFGGLVSNESLYSSGSVNLVK